MSSIASSTERSKTYNQVLLATAIVKVYGQSGKWYHCRALLDSGSQSNFITEKLMRKLCLPRKKVNHRIVGVGDSSHNATYELTLSIQSRINPYKAVRSFLVLPKITSDLPNNTQSVIKSSIPENIILANPTFYQRGNIDMLIGADLYWELMCANIFQLPKFGPFLQETKLGWIVSGRVSQGKSNEISSCMMVCDKQDKCLSEQIEKFWKIEECKPSVDNWSSEEIKCINHFKETVQRDVDGKFIVQFPFKNNVNQLGKSYKIAMRRFLSLENRLIQRNEIYEGYREFMRVYQELGHMEEIINDDSEHSNNYTYLPHSYVLNEKSRTTKLRVVFDASSKTETGVSLNDVLMKGPVLQQDMVKLIARFRTRKYAFAGDIIKMYRQIWIDKSQRHYQCILWRSNKDKKIKAFRLCTVTYGTVPASFQAINSLINLADETNDAKVADIIKYDFCVDDCLTGGSTLEETIKMRDELISTMRKGGFEMSKWTANHSELINNIPGVSSSKNEFLNFGESIVKTVGLCWEPRTDYLTYNVKLMHNEKYTKRNILSNIAKLFDPLGLIGPVIIVAKIIMQLLWLEKVNWDDELPGKIRDKWQNFCNEVKYVNKIKIPRWVGTTDLQRTEIHGFCDASTHAYGACLYLRTINNINGQITTNLLCAKSRVAPLKSTSIPRLELCAAVLLTRLAKNIIPTLRANITSQYWWTDSQVVLAWITSESSRWKVYVANRVGEIHESTEVGEWLYVKSDENPADILSRGCTPIELNKNKLWWCGPEWLQRSDENWKIKNINNKNVINLPGICNEEKREFLSLIITDDKNSLLNFEKYSSWNTLIRVIAYIIRFYRNALSNIRNTTKIIGLLSESEIQNALMTFIRMLQRYAFEAEIRALGGHAGERRAISNKSNLFRLNPFIDENKILRLGGRLRHANNLSYDQKHPIILPNLEPFTTIFFRGEHERMLHAGAQAMLATIRLKYWPIKGRGIARKIVHNCVRCFKVKPTILEPIMGDLPKYRIEKPAKCFEVCGIDYAGPVFVKSSHRRNAAQSKAYICVFICFATKAVNLKLVYDLTTDGFLASLRRFISRRGICRHIYSDNATNFIGAHNKLEELKNLWASIEYKNRVQHFLNEYNISWHFIPPRSPHFGGLWEAAVKSVKHHLNRTVATTKLTYDELYTLLVQIEACLNSRPLVPLSNDPYDLAILTPAHFLIGGSLLALPQADITLCHENQLSRWERVQKLTQHIWKRWSTEYLNSLQVRAKWSKNHKQEIEVGTMVLIKEDNVLPLQWCMGRVIEVQPGKDGIVRVAVVKTPSGTKKRAVRKLCPLPIQYEQNSE